MAFLTLPSCKRRAPVPAPNLDDAAADRSTAQQLVTGRSGTDVTNRFPELVEAAGPQADVAEPTQQARLQLPVTDAANTFERPDNVTPMALGVTIRGDAAPLGRPAI